MVVRYFCRRLWGRNWSSTLILAGDFGLVGVVLLGEGTTGLMTLFSSGLFFDGEDGEGDSGQADGREGEGE